MQIVLRNFQTCFRILHNIILEEAIYSLCCDSLYIYNMWVNSKCKIIIYWSNFRNLLCSKFCKGLSSTVTDLFIKVREFNLAIRDILYNLLLLFPGFTCYSCSCMCVCGCVCVYYLTLICLIAYLCKTTLPSTDEGNQTSSLMYSAELN